MLVPQEPLVTVDLVPLEVPVVLELELGVD